MAGVRQILKYQWKAYWRRFTRPGQLAQFDILLLLLLGALLIFKLPPVLRRAAREMAIGQTVAMDQLLFALAAAWIYPRIESAIISIHPKDLIRFPLTTNSLLLVRIGMTLRSLPGVAIIYLTRFNSELLAAKLVSVLALTTLVYLVSLHLAGRKFERDWQKISYRLS